MELSHTRAVIVFESMFGNTEKIARELGDGLASEGMQVLLVDVRHVRPADVTDCDLLVVGAPTHAFSLSRPSTRADAVRQGAEGSRAATGLREWLTGIDDVFDPATASLRRPRVAAFDTRADRVEHWPGSAGRKAARLLRHHGFELVDRAASFYVRDVKGPLVAGERERARVWARHLADQLRSATQRAS